MSVSKIPESQKGEVANLAEAASRIQRNKAQIKAKTQTFAREVKLKQLMVKGRGQQR